MQPTVQVIERTETPRGELQLQRRGDHYEIVSNGVFLMATYNGKSEKLLVRAALDHLVCPESVVIGGLGVGFSLAEALTYPSVRDVKVVEIEAAIIEWDLGHLAAFSANSLDDSRTQVVQADLLEWMWNDTDTYDAICLDIDNGPDWTVTGSNASLYQTKSLARLAHLLRPGGVVAFWSASHSSAFQNRLEQIFEDVHVERLSREKGADDCIYIAFAGKNHV